MQDLENFRLHAWVDESMRPSTKGDRMYLLGAAVADPYFCDASREELRKLLPKGAKKLHWTDMERKQKTKVTDLVAGFDMAHLVVVGTPLDHRKQEHARAKCMERLLWELDQLGVTHVFLEQRTESLNKRDLQLVLKLRGKRSISSDIRVDVAPPSTDPMLWIPDQVLGAVGEAEASEVEWLEKYQGGVAQISIHI